MSGDSGRLQRLDAKAARRWAVATRAAFAAHRAEIDELNVFPVPDGDTGTNLYITLDSALESARTTREQAEPPGRSLASGQSAGHQPEPEVEATLAADAAILARATLLAARGNSGVILSQLVRGLSEVIAETATCDAAGAVTGTTSSDGMDGPTLARAVRRASDRAYASVTRPVEGTILSVAAAAAGAAELAAATGSDLYGVAHAALAAARRALADTTTQLQVLAHAGVVDAGGLGYVLVLEALEMVVAGGPSGAPRPDTVMNALEADAGLTPVALSQMALRAAAHAEVDGSMGGHGSRDGQGSIDGNLSIDGPGGGEPKTPAYEVMYLLSDSDEGLVAVLRGRLDVLGDSVLVVGGGDLWNVHVHVDDVGAAIQAGIEAGRPHRIAVTHFGDQRRARAVTPPRGPVAVVACASGEGLAEVFRAAGAVPVFSGPGRRASAGQLLDAIRLAGSRCVIVLPNDDDTQLAAEAAASAAADEGLEVHVVRSRSAVQGIAALAVFEPTTGGQDNHVAMSGAAGATRHAAVTVASKQSLTSAGWCRPGDVLGVLDGEVVVVGTDLATVGAELVARLLAGGGELLTVITGADVGQALSDAVAHSARQAHRDVEISLIDGGQATYPLLLGVE